MTVIRHNSISGIVSITAAAGSNLSFYDSTGATLSLDTGDINAGVITATTANFTNATVTGDLTVQGTTTTLDTTVTEVDRLEVGANNTTVGVAITQSGTGDILRLYDGASQVVTVKDGGSVGIGTDNPGRLLHLYNIDAPPLLIDRNLSGERYIVELRQSDTTDGNRFRLAYQSDTTGAGAASNVNFASIEFAADIHDQATRAGSIRFNTSQGGVGNEIERFRITSSGNIGIGITNPTAKFELSTNNAGAVQNNVIRFTDTDASFQAGQSPGRIEWNTSDANSPGVTAYIDTYGYTNAVSDLVFGAGLGGSATERLRIHHTGKVGIGTDNPARVLDVEGNAQIINNGGTAFITGRDRALETYGAIGFVDADTIQITAGSGGSRNVAMQFRTASSGTETTRMTIDSAGRLFVGTNLTSSTLVSPGSVFSQTTGMDFSSTTVDATTAHGFYAGMSSNTGNIGTGYWINHGGLKCGMAGFRVSTSNWGTDLRFYTHPETTSNQHDVTQRFRIAANGWLASTPPSNVDAFNILHAATAGTSRRHIYATANGTQTFSVYTNGNVTNTNNSYGAISDINMKENIIDAPSQWNDIKSLQIRKYNFKEETGQPTHTQLGVIAQEVEIISPGLVLESPDKNEENQDLGTTTKSVNYSVLYMKAVKALQEAQERIESLEARLDAAGL